VRYIVRHEGFRIIVDPWTRCRGERQEDALARAVLGCERVEEERHAAPCGEVCDVNTHCYIELVFSLPRRRVKDDLFTVGCRLA
jgi:hypothetical protein